MTSFIVTLALFWNQTLDMSDVCPYSGKCRQESSDSFALSPPFHHPERNVKVAGISQKLTGLVSELFKSLSFFVFLFFSPAS